jgi:hypothetical protein
MKTIIFIYVDYTKIMDFLGFYSMEFQEALSRF